MSFGKWLGILFLMLAAALELSRSTAYAQDFYKGKTIRIVVATTPGGGFDAYSRMIARHMSKHIPGNPASSSRTCPARRF